MRWVMLMVLVGCGDEPLDLAGRTFENDRFVIAFDTDDRLVASTPCNEMHADYSLDRDRLIVANGTYTGELCTPEGAQEASAFFDILKAMPALELDDAVLTVRNATTTVVLPER